MLGVPGDTMKFKIWPLLIYNICFFTIVYIGQMELSEKSMLDEGTRMVKQKHIEENEYGESLTP